MFCIKNHEKSSPFPLNLFVITGMAAGLRVGGKSSGVISTEKCIDLILQDCVEIANDADFHNETNNYRPVFQHSLRCKSSPECQGLLWCVLFSWGSVVFTLFLTLSLYKMQYCRNPWQLIKTARTKEGSCILLMSICASRELHGSEGSIGERRCCGHWSGSHVTTACPRQDLNQGLPWYSNKQRKASCNQNTTSGKTTPCQIPTYIYTGISRDNPTCDLSRDIPG